VGMVGPLDSIIGAKKETVFDQLLSQVPFKYELSPDENISVSAVILDIDEKTGKARGIKRIKKVMENV